MNQDTPNTNWIARIRDWHTARRRADLSAMFDLGDMLLRATVHADIGLGEVITIIISDMGDLAYNKSIYYNAVKVAKTFTKWQRKTLIELGVSGVKAVNLAGCHYDKGLRRSKTITQMKSGKIPPPWKCIRGENKPIEIEARRAPEVKEHNHVISIPVYGSSEQLEDALTSLLSQLGPDKFSAYYGRAIERLNKSGQVWPRMRKE